MDHQSDNTNPERNNRVSGPPSRRGSLVGLFGVVAPSKNITLFVIHALSSFTSIEHDPKSSSR